MHQKAHSFKSNNADTLLETKGCEECNYSCKIIETLDVHLGKGYLSSFDCGLFDSLSESSEVLDTQLNTCEVYECGKCYERFTMLNLLKNNAEEEHLECDHLLLIKMEKNNKTEVNMKKYSISEL